MIDILANIALCLLLLGSVTFVAPYVFMVKRWYREEHRAHVVAFSGVVLAFAVLYVIRMAHGGATPADPHSAFQWVRLVLLWLLALVVVWRALIFWRGVWRRRVQRRRLSEVTSS